MSKLWLHVQCELSKRKNQKQNYNQQRKINSEKSVKRRRKRRKYAKLHG